MKVKSTPKLSAHEGLWRDRGSLLLQKSRVREKCPARRGLWIGPCRVNKRKGCQRAWNCSCTEQSCLVISHGTEYWEVPAWEIPLCKNGSHGLLKVGAWSKQCAVREEKVQRLLGGDQLQRETCKDSIAVLQVDTWNS